MNKEIEALLEKHYDRECSWYPKQVDVLQNSVHFIDYHDTETVKMIVFDRDNNYKHYHMTYDMVHKVLLFIDALNG